MSDYIISTESTADLPYDYFRSRNINVIFYGYEIDGRIYEDNMERDPAASAEFYDQIEKGNIPSTSQINPMKYEEYFEELLQHGDIIHLAMGNGFSASVQNAINAAAELTERYPGRRIYVVNTLCGSGGLGLFADTAADKRDSGMSLEELHSWAEDNKLRFHHEFFNSNLMYLKRTGRLSGASALVGSILNIVPSMHVDGESRLVAYGKERGKKKAIRHMLDEMLAHCESGADYSGKCIVAGSNCDEDEDTLEAALKENFPKAKIVRSHIGLIISAHCGPGTLSLYYYGDPRS